MSALPPEAHFPSPRRPALLIVVGLLLLLGVVGLAGFAGYQAGLTERNSTEQATRAADLLMQYNLGLADMNSGHYDLAATRFEYILGVDPAYPGAAGQLARAQAQLHITPTAPAVPTLSGDTPAAILAVAEQQAAAGNWDGVISQVALLHAADPAYEVVRADGLLFVALRNRGVARIQGDSMEEGIFDLTQAEAFGPLDSEAVNYRAWARLYLAAQSYWGVNWETAVQILQQLYVLAPNFHDTTQKLYQATLAYARQLNAAGDYCGAAAQFLSAQTVVADPAAAEAQATAQATCLLTPTVDLTAGAPPASGTPPMP